jgi:hypothetical protein
MARASSDVQQGQSATKPTVHAFHLLMLLYSIYNKTGKECDPGIQDRNDKISEYHVPDGLRRIGPVKSTRLRY